MINDVLVSSSCSNDHTFSGLNNTNLFSYRAGGQKSEMNLTGPKSWCSQGFVLSGTSREASLQKE